ncbi:hypothetical protein [Nocardioides ultimimeridianus]
MCGLLACVVVVLLSPSFGRARPSGSYRPLLPPDALTNGCYPLPAGVRLDLPYQVRRDGDTVVPGEGRRRRLELQYDLIDVGPATSRLSESFVRAGFRETGSSAGPTPGSRSIRLARKGIGTVSAVVTPLSPLGSDQIVRGTIVLDLPVAAPASDSPVCSDPGSTKRYPTEPTP